MKLEEVVHRSSKQSNDCSKKYHYYTVDRALPALLCTAVKRSPQYLCNKTTKSVIKHWTIWVNCSVCL